MPRTIPLEDFFRNPDKTRFQISPSGDYLSYMAPWQNRLNVFTQHIGTNTGIQVTRETERNVSGYFWGSNSKIIFLKDKGGDENFHLYAVSLDGKDERDLTPFDGITVQVIDSLEENDDEVIIGMNQRNKEIFDAYRLNINTGALILEAENPGNVTDWITDHNGEIRIATTTDGVNNSFLYREKKSDEFKTLLTTNFRESLSPLFFTFTNKELYALSNLNRDKAAIVLFDLQTGKEKEVLFQHGDVDLGSLHFSHKRKVLTIIHLLTGSVKQFFSIRKLKGSIKESKKNSLQKIQKPFNRVRKYKILKMKLLSLPITGMKQNFWFGLTVIAHWALIICMTMNPKNYCISLM